MMNGKSVNVSNTNLGKIEIAPEVIEIISGIAASEVKGVSSMRGSFAADVVERFGKKAHNKGVKVELSERGILMDVYVELNFGVSIPRVAEQLQQSIKQSLKNMTALEIDKINVHVVGIQMKQENNDPLK